MLIMHSFFMHIWVNWRCLWRNEEKKETRLCSVTGVKSGEHLRIASLNIFTLPAWLQCAHAHTLTDTHTHRHTKTDRDRERKRERIAARQGVITKDVLQLAQRHSPETMATQK